MIIDMERDKAFIDWWKYWYDQDVCMGSQVDAYEAWKESAEQARKEAAKKAVAFVKMLSSEARDLWGVWEDEHLQLAIMGGCDVCPTMTKCYRTESTPLLNVGNSEQIPTERNKHGLKKYNE